MNKTIFFEGDRPTLTRQQPICTSYRNQLTDGESKPIDWLLYDRNTGH